jgi:mono/diheme cytochrome c family protein
VKRALVITAALSAMLGACRGQPSEDSPVLLLRNMYHQQRYNAQSLSQQYSDHRSMRQPVEGTVARENFIEDERISHGLENDGTTYVATIPQEIAPAFGGAPGLVARGQERYNIYCAPCHGRAGDGQGMVFLRSRVAGYQYPPPATFHDNRIRHMPDGQLFATISNGIRNMPAYAAQIPVNDRWAIVSYVRALELSQGNAAAPAGAPTAAPTTTPTAGAAQ